VCVFDMRVCIVNPLTSLLGATRTNRQVTLVNFDTDGIEFVEELGRGGSAIVYR
jgi:hypothetical protein